LREGLLALREFAEEVTFEEKLIERERGVILSEMATRNTPMARSGTSNLAFLWPSSRHVRRPIGGIPETIRAFKRTDFVSFYDAWYRPERMAIVVVGNVDPTHTAPLLESLLGKIAARGIPRPEPTDLTPTMASAPDIEIFSDPGLVGVLMTLQRPVAVPQQADTHARRVALLHQGLAFSMFHQRLQKIAHDPRTSFLAPIASISEAIREWHLAGLTVSGRITDWKRVAADIEQEHRRAYQFGFTAQELAEAKAGFSAAYEQSVRTSATWPSDWLAGRLVTCLVEGKVFMHPAELQRDQAEALSSASLSDCLQEFRQAWTTGAPHVFISAHPSFQITREEIAATLNRSRTENVTPREDTAPIMPFAYEDFGPSGKLVREEHVTDLDVRLTEFANGARVNFKQTSFKADTVEVRVRVGDGKLSQPPGRPGLDILGNFAVMAGGLRRHTAPELSSILAGRAVSVTFHIDPDSCTFKAHCARREFGFCLQLIAAYLNDAAYRPAVMREAQASFYSMYASLAAAPSGPISLRAWRVLANGDLRFGFPSFEELFARNMGELKAWVEPQFQRGPLEMSVVGDIAWDDAIADLARTIGALTPREPHALQPTRTNRLVQPPAAKREATIIPIAPALQQCAIAWYWPVPPPKDHREERRHHLLAHVLDERCRVRIREELGAAYVTAAGFQETSGFPRLTAFTVFAEVAPRHAQKAMEIIHRESVALMKKGVSADEFERVRQPYLQHRSQELRTNVYWVGTVLSDAQQHPQRLAAARDRTSDTASITAADLSRLARLHLDPAKAFRFATVPTAPKPSAGGSKSAATPAAQAP
jgi:zinc protease